MEGIGIHKIEDICTLIFLITEDNSDKVNVLIKNEIHVPTIDVSLVTTSIPKV